MARRREDASIRDRLAVVEAVQDEHRALFASVSLSLESLVRIESDNAVARQRAKDHGEDIDVLKAEMPTLKIVRYLVFAAALAVLGSALTMGWSIVTAAGKAQVIGLGGTRAD